MTTVAGCPDKGASKYEPKETNPLGETMKPWMDQQPQLVNFILGRDSSVELKIFNGAEALAKITGRSAISSKMLAFTHFQLAGNHPSCTPCTPQKMHAVHELL